MIDKNNTDNNNAGYVMTTTEPQERCFHCNEWTTTWRVINVLDEVFFVCEECDNNKIKVKL